MLADTLRADLQKAQLEKNENKVSTLRMLISEIKYAEISKGQELADADLVTVIQREVKKRREAAAGFREGDREEQAVKEEQEAEILSAYLPVQLTDEELTNIVDEAISQTGAVGITDMGRVIGVVMGKAAGKTDGSRVSAVVKAKLQG